MVHSLGRAPSRTALRHFWTFFCVLLPWGLLLLVTPVEEVQVLTCAEFPQWRYVDVPLLWLDVVAVVVVLLLVVVPVVVAVLERVDVVVVDKLVGLVLVLVGRVVGMVVVVAEVGTWRVVDDEVVDILHSSPSWTLLEELVVLEDWVVGLQRK